MKPVELPSKELLHKLFIYDETTGFLSRKVKVPFSKVNVGDVIKCKDRNGYIKVGVGGKNYKAHRIIYKMMSDDFDEKLIIDHINGDTSDNRYCNLRQCTQAANIVKKRVCSGNNKYRGVHFYPKIGFVARGYLKCKQYHLGAFKTAEEAALTYNKFVEQHYGDFCVKNDINPTTTHYAKK